MNHDVSLLSWETRLFPYAMLNLCYVKVRIYVIGREVSLRKVNPRASA